MGLFSTKSSSSNTNIDNRVVNDYQGADVDRSINNEYDQSATGFANNSGSINVVDGGAFEVVGAANESMANLVGDLGMYNSEVTETALNVGANALSDTALLIDAMGERSLTGSMALNDSINLAGMDANDLTFDLAQLNAETLTNQQDDNNDALNTGFKGMLQFAENFSRSDGNELAKTNMQTIGLIMGGFAVIAVGFILLKGK